MLSYLSSYSFLLLALATALLGISAALIGALTVFQEDGLVADALGHASFPGVVLAFMISGQRAIPILLLGAASAGFLAYGLIQALNHRTKIHRDNLLAIILTGFFGGGLVLKSYIQGNPNFQESSQAGLRDYIFGQAAYLSAKDCLQIAIVTAVVLLLLYFFHRPLKVFIFDPQYAHTLGYSRRLLQLLLWLLTVLLVTVGLRSVGAILMSSLFIAPINIARF